MRKRYKQLDAYMNLFHLYCIPWHQLLSYEYLIIGVVACWLLGNVHQWTHLLYLNSHRQPMRLAFVILIHNAMAPRVCRGVRQTIKNSISNLAILNRCTFKYTNPIFKEWTLFLRMTGIIGVVIFFLSFLSESSPRSSRKSVKLSLKCISLVIG